MKNMQWARLLAYVAGMVNQRLLLQNEYLVAENRVLRAHLPGPAASDQSRTVYAGRNRQTTCRKSSARGCLRSQTGYNPVGGTTSCDAIELRQLLMAGMDFFTVEVLTWQGLV